MVVGGGHRRRRHVRKTVRKTVRKHRRPGRPRGSVSRRRVVHRVVRRRRTTLKSRTGLSSHTVVQLRRLAKRAGVRASSRGHPLKKSALIRALSSKRR